PKIKAGIFQLRSSDWGASLHHPANPRDGVVVVEAGRPDQTAALSVENRKRRFSEIAARDGFVPGQSRPHVLKVQVVLVGPEPGDLAVRLGHSGHRAADDEALALRGLEVLDANPRLQQRMPETGSVTRGEHALDRSAAALVDHDAAVDRKPRPLGEERARLGA